MVPPFAAEPMRQGGCQGWGAAPPGAQRRALALTQEPRALHCEPLKEGAATAEGQAQAGRSRVPTRAASLAVGGCPGRCASAATTPAGWRSHANRQERSDPRSPLGGTGGTTRRPARLPVPRTGATAEEAARVPGVPGQAWRGGVVTGCGAGVAGATGTAPRPAGARSRPARAGEYAW